MRAAWVSPRAGGNFPDAGTRAHAHPATSGAASAERLENRMPRRLPGRRALLRAAAISGAVLPALAIGNRVLASSRPADLSAPLLSPEICRASFKAPVVLAATRALKLSFNANAVCTVGEIGRASCRERVCLYV